jgi:hypothetical protein
VRLRTLVLAALPLCLGCGTLASPGGGDSNLPAGRNGPYRLLDSEELPAGSCLLREDGVALEDPAALPLDLHRVALYFTRREGARRTIRRAVVVDGQRLEGDPTDALAPSLAWHGDGVGAPDVSATRDGFAMVFDTAAGLGLATSADGRAWRPADAPLLVASADAGEVTPLRAPTLLVRPDGSIVLAYESAGAVWAAAGATLAAPLVRVDADARTPRREALLAPGDDARDAGAVGYASGAVGDPSLRAEESVAGRTLFRLFFSARSAPFTFDGGVDFNRAVGIAGSFDGARFLRAETAVLTSRTDPAVGAPSAWSDGALRTWLFVSGRCDGAGRNVGIRVAVAPGNRRYPLAR